MQSELRETRTRVFSIEGGLDEVDVGEDVLDLRLLGPAERHHHLFALAVHEDASLGVGVLVGDVTRLVQSELPESPDVSRDGAPQPREQVSEQRGPVGLLGGAQRTAGARAGERVRSSVPGNELVE